MCFQRNLDTYFMLTHNRPKNIESLGGKSQMNFAVLNMGSPCCGMNAAVRSFVRNCIILGHRPLGIQVRFFISAFSVHVPHGACYLR
jgi:6-phosphofructokinase 1